MSSILRGIAQTVRRHPARVLLVVGTVMAIQSIAWEYVRMRPDYRFLVEPWSLRGYELTQGIVVSVLAAGLLVLAVLAWNRIDQRVPGFGVMVAGATIAAAVAVAVVVSPEAKDYNLNSLAAIAVALSAGAVIALIYRDVVGKRFGEVAGYATIPIWLVSALLLWLFVITPLLVDETQTIELWVIVLVALLAFFVPAVLSEDRSLAVNRILILAVTATWLVQIISAGAIRSTLLRKQTAEIGVAAQFKDAQITSGMMLAFFGLLLALLGAIALWAKRRDELEAQRRARQQRRAAEESMEELAPAQ